MMDALKNVPVWLAAVALRRRPAGHRQTVAFAKVARILIEARKKKQEQNPVA